MKRTRCREACREMHTFERGCELHIGLFTQIKWKLARGAEAVGRGIGSALDEITNFWY